MPFKLIKLKKELSILQHYVIKQVAYVNKQRLKQLCVEMEQFVKRQERNNGN